MTTTGTAHADDPRHPVQVGSMLFTMVDPTPGNEVAYNRWYERDHYYSGCMIGPYLLAGSRWVATRRLKDLRWSDGTGQVADPIDKGSYLSIYWVEEGHHNDHFGWARTQVYALYKDGRGFNERVHAHTIMADQPRTVYRDADPVPLTLAFDHRYAGLIALGLDRADGTDEAALNAALDDKLIPDLLADSAIASVVSWKPEPREGEAPMDLGTSPGDERRQLQLMFIEGPAEDSMPAVTAYIEAMQASGVAEPRWAAPFTPTIIGTDTYTDELW